MRDPHVRLTEEEQRRLEALETALAAEDPHLARRLRSGRRLPLVGCVLAGPPARGALGVLLLVGGIVTFLLAITGSTLIAFAGCAAVAAGGYLTLTCPRAVRMFHRLDAWFRPHLLRDRSADPPR
jgi:hypothetical protein